MTTKELILNGSPFCIPGTPFDYRIVKNQLVLHNGRRTVAAIEIEHYDENFFAVDDSYIPGFSAITYSKCELK